MIISIFNSLPRGGIHRATPTPNIATRTPLPLRIVDTAARTLLPTSTLNAARTLSRPNMPTFCTPPAPTFNIAARTLLPTGTLNAAQTLLHPKGPTSYAASRLPRILEVERKFAPTSASIKMLRENTANLTQRFTHHEYLGTQTIRDAYFDKNGVLMDQGIYLRKRDDEWEVKVRKAGGYINSSFEEFSDLGTIMKVVEGALGDDGKSGSGNGDGEQGASALIHRMCDCVADMRTTREMWEVDGFKVVIDKMCFGHMVGEVELVCEVADSQGDEKDGEKEMLEMMDGRIEKFMGEHGDVFPRGGKVEGKLSAWFRVEKERRGT